MDAETKALIEAQNNQINNLAASVKLLADRDAERVKRDEVAAHNARVERVIAAAVQAGKVVPATVKAKDDQGRYILDADQAEDILEAIPASVPTQFQGGQARPGADTITASTADEDVVCASLGISMDEWKRGATVIKRALEPAPSGVPLVA
jgi:hypothetical protein